MSLKPTTIERAFELARSGRVANIEEIRVILKSEGYNVAKLSGPLLLRQLRLGIYDAALRQSAMLPGPMELRTGDG